MSDFVGMLLQAKIDPDAIGNIQKQIEDISKNAKAIKLNIDVDDKVLKDIENINKKIGLAINKSSNTVKIDGDFDKLKVHMDSADNIKKIVTDTTIEYGKQLQTIEKLNIKTGELEPTEKRLTINKEITQKLKEQVELFKKQQEIKVKNLEGKYKGIYDKDAIAKYRQELQQLSVDTPNATYEMKRMALGLKDIEAGAKNSKKSIDLANKSSMSFGEALKTAAYKFGIWSAVTASYYKIISEIRNGIRFVTEMDTALTEIGMVTNQTREQTASLAKEYNNLAKEMKVTTSEIISGAVEFYRQGLSQEEVMERLKTTTMYSKVANVDFKESAELLTATVNSMGISIEKAADVFLFLGDATATSGEEIGKGFAKTSGSAAALGVEFEKVASWIATISSKTRESAESIGYSINTMLSRLSRITETGFNEEDDTKLNDVSKALHTIGIELTDQEGNFRNFGTIMDEIYAKWGKLDDQTKAYIANVMAGTRQQSRFYNLMEGYSESIDLYNKSLEASGTAQSKFNLYMESNQAIIDTFKTSLEGFWSSFLDSDVLMTFVKLGTSFIETLDAMVQKFGSIKSILGVLIPLIGVKLTLALRSAYVELAKTKGTAIGITLGQAIKQMLGLTEVTEGATVALGALNIKLIAVTVGLSLIPLLIAKIANAEKERKEAFDNAVDDSQKLNDEVNSLEQLAKKQEELTNTKNKSVEQKEELIKVQKELAQLYPELATGIDSEGNKIAENAELTKQLTEEKRKLLEQELLIIKTTADEKLPVLKQELEAMQKEAEEIQKRLVSGNTKEVKDFTARGRTIKATVDVTDELKNRLLELVEAQKEHMEEIVKLEDGVKSYNQILDENAEKQKWARVEELQNQVAKASSIKELKRIEEELKKLGFTSEDITNILSGNIDIVKNKYKKLDEQQIINLQTIENLDATQKQAMLNMLENSRIATNQLIADTKARITAIQAEMNALIALTGGKAEQINLMSKKTSPEEMLDTISGGFSKTLAAAARNDAIEAQRELAKLEGNLKNIDKALANVKNIDTKKISGLSDGGKSNKSKSGSGSKSKKDEPNFIDPIDAEIRAIQSKNDYLEKTNELLNEQLNLAKNIEGIEGLNEQYKINGQIIENNKKLLQSYKKEQDELHNKANKLRNSNKKYNIDSWFDANGEQTQAYINQYNRASKKEQENMDKVFQQMQKIKKAWMDSDKEAKNLVNTTRELEREIGNIAIQQQDLVRNKLKDLIEAEKRNAYLDLELRQRQANEQLKAAKQEMEDEVARYQSRIDSIQAEIDSIQESERARQENLERAKRLEEISKLQNKYYVLQYKNLSTLTEEQAKALGLEKEREQYLERQAKIQELVIKLENVRREKNIQQLTKANDGTWQFEYVADEKEIDNINKQVEDLQKEHNKSLKDLKEQTLTDLKSKQEDYDEWERQNDIRRQIEEKQRRIQRYQDEIADLQNQYAKKERITNEAFERERKNLDRFYYDIDVLTDEKMEELNKTFGDNWEKIYETLTGKFSSITEAYLAMVDIISQPIDTGMSNEEIMDYNERIAREQGVTLTNNRPTDKQSSSKNDWSKIYNDARAKGDYKTMEYANRQANIERGKGDVVTSNKDIEYIKKKVKGYSTGIEQGLITKDHLAMLHGDKTNWEGVFTKAQLDKLLKSAVLSTVNLITPKVPNVALAGAGGGDIKQNVNIDKLEFPNVKDAKEIEKSIKSLSTYANQWANRK